MTPPDARSTMPGVSEAEVEAAAEAMWQAEALRAIGRPRSVPWSNEGEDTHQKWRGLARAALQAAAQVRTGHDGEVDRKQAATLGLVEGHALVIRQLEAKIAAAEARATQAEETVERLREREAIFNAGIRLLWSDAVFVGSHWEEPLNAEKGLWPTLCVHVSSYGADAEEVAREHWQLLADLIDKHGEDAGEAYACWKRGTSDPAKGKLSRAGREALAAFKSAAALADPATDTAGAGAGEVRA